MTLTKPKFQPDERYGYTGISGAVSITGWSKSSIYKATAKCEIPHFKLGRKLVFKISDLLDFIEQHKIDAVR
jgi:hypothetical protein